MLHPDNRSNPSSEPGQVRRRRSGNFPPSSTDGPLAILRITLDSARPPTRRLRCLHQSRLRPLTSRAHTHRRRQIAAYRRHSELLRALVCRLPSRPAQRASSIRLADLDARAIPPRMRRHRHLRRPRRRRLLPHLRPHPHPHPRMPQPLFRTPPGCGALHVRLFPTGL